LNDQDIVRSVECDLYPEHAPEKSERLNAIGELSPFHQQFGYYADGVGPETAVLPNGWEGRRSLIEVRTLRAARVLGWCLELHDLLVAKYVAGREKDLTYCAAVIRLRLVSKKTLKERLAATSIGSRRHQQIRAFVDAAFGTNDAYRP